MNDPTYDDRLADWFSGMFNIPTLVIVTGMALWTHQPPLTTIRRWTTLAPPTLQRLEIWSPITQVQFTEGHHLGRIWTKGERFKYVFVKDDQNVWGLEDQASMLNVELMDGHCG